MASLFPRGRLLRFFLLLFFALLLSLSLPRFSYLWHCIVSTSVPGPEESQVSGADITFAQVLLLRFLCGLVLSCPYKNLSFVSISQVNHVTHPWGRVNWRDQLTWGALWLRRSKLPRKRTPSVRLMCPLTTQLADHGHPQAEQTLPQVFPSAM